MANSLICRSFWPPNVARFGPYFTPKTALCRTSFSAGEHVLGRLFALGLMAEDWKPKSNVLRFLLNARAADLKCVSRVLRRRWASAA